MSKMQSLTKKLTDDNINYVRKQILLKTGSNPYYGTNEVINLIESKIYIGRGKKCHICLNKYPNPEDKPNNPDLHISKIQCILSNTCDNEIVLEHKGKNNTIIHKRFIEKPIELSKKGMKKIFLESRDNIVIEEYRLSFKKMII